MISAFFMPVEWDHNLVFSPLGIEQQRHRTNMGNIYVSSANGVDEGRGPMSVRRIVQFFRLCRCTTVVKTM